MSNSSGIIDPPIDTLLGKAPSKYALVIYAAQRARQINDYYADLHEGNLYDNVGPLVECSVDDKALTIALHEIAQDKLELVPRKVAEARRAELEAQLAEVEAQNAEALVNAQLLAVSEAQFAQDAEDIENFEDEEDK